MTWVLHDNADRAIVEEIETQPDRGAALVAAAFVENRLLQAIKIRIDSNMAPEIAGRLFVGPYAIIGAFAAKTDLGYALQLYSKPVYNLLAEVRGIRNKFAHEMKPLSFDSQNINDLCTRKIPPLLPACSVYGRKHIHDLEMQLGYPERRHWYGLYAIAEDIVTPRQIYMAAVKSLLLLLSLAMDVFAQHRIVLPPSPDRFSLPPLQAAPRPNRDRKKRERPPGPSSA